jgi:hypothetical protein
LNEEWDVDGKAVANPDFSTRTWLSFPVVSSSQNASPHCLLAWCSFELHREQYGSGNKKQTREVARNLREHNSVYWLRHGVVCGVDKLARAEWCGAALALDVSDRRTDVTGLAFSQAPLRADQSRKLLEKLWREALPPLKSTMDQKLPTFSLPAAGEVVSERLLSVGLLTVCYLFLSALAIVMLPEVVMKYLFLPGLVTVAVGSFFLTPKHTKTKQAREAVNIYRAGRDPVS